MSIDFPPPDGNTFDEDDLERVEIVEHLPFSHAFERVMYDSRIQRRARHDMDRPIRLTPFLTEAIIPDEVSSLIPSSNSTIADLIVEHVDTPTTEPQLTISFTVDGKHHLMNTSDGTYQIEAYSNTDSTYRLDPAIATRLLAALVYARQYDELDPSVPISYSESNLDLPRSNDDTLIERLIVTLGNTDGQSTITTTSFINTADGDTLVARLSEGQTPTIDSLQSNLELARLVSISESTETDLHQNIVHTATQPVVSPKPITLENRFAEQRRLDADPILIDPNSNFEEWVEVCGIFLSAIDDRLEKYAYLDEEPV